MRSGRHGERYDALSGPDGPSRRPRRDRGVVPRPPARPRDGAQPLNEKAAAILDAGARARLGRLAARLDGLPAWEEEALEAAVRAAAEDEGVKLVAMAQPLRAAIAGSNTSPSMFEVMRILGKDESLLRIRAQSQSVA